MESGFRHHPYLRLTVLLLLPMRFDALPAPRHRKGRVSPDLAEILSRMSDSARHLKTVSANLEYTTVTVLVNDESTEFGQIFFRKTAKKPEILIDFARPDPKAILLNMNKGKAEIYLPKINQIQEYDVGRRSELVQQFLLLGFGTEVGELRKAYDLKFVDEEDIAGETAAVLELTPRRSDVAAQLSKVQLWISEDSWLPVQQKFFETGGDYLIARYSSTKVNREIPSSTFEIKAAKGAKRVKMN